MITLNDRQEFLISLNSHLPANIIGAEIGVLDGRFAKLLFDFTGPTKLHLIDPFENNDKHYANGGKTAYSSCDHYLKVADRFRPQIQLGMVVIDIGYSYNVVDNYREKYFDFIYHDASHLYKDIKKDLIDWLPKLKDDGLMCGHDYIQHEDFGVIQAVDEFCKEQNFEMIIFNENGGDYALKRKP